MGATGTTTTGTTRTVRHDTAIGTFTLAASPDGLTRCRLHRNPPTPGTAPTSGPTTTAGPTTTPGPTTTAGPTMTAGPAMTAGAVDERAGRWLDQAVRELDEYLDGRRREFAVPVDLSRVEPGRRHVLRALAAVGYGETVTYGALAAAAGLTGPEAARQVGGAMAANPVLVIVPCHRVVGANGTLTGYAGGLPAKRALLDLESAHLALF